MNLFSPDDKYTPVPMYRNYTRLKEDIIETTAEHRWIAIVAELVLVQVFDEHDTISSLKSQATSSEPDSAQ